MRLLSPALGMLFALRSGLLLSRCGRAGGLMQARSATLQRGLASTTKKKATGLRAKMEAVEVEEKPLVRDEERIANDGAEPIQLDAEMSDSFMKYAMSTILGRALPDVRDGLKPVHRRILYSMRELGLQPNQPHRKCARVVGEVLGKFHPHGDASVYSAMVRMTQDWVMSRRLVDGHGNFGSVDDDAAAAMRYTECRLTAFCYESLLNPEDLGKVSAEAEATNGLVQGISVDFEKNFDGREYEPLVLPARVPLLLVNGASGIAVGMATNIPPHNLGEVVDATIVVAKALQKEAVTGNPLDVKTLIEELATALPAPDFPTGGTIMGTKETERLYATGQGSIKLRAKTHFETNEKNGRVSIIATELPYMVTKSAMIKMTADLVNAKKIEGISDIRDESGRVKANVKSGPDGMRVVYELKKDVNPEIVLNVLFKSTRLESTFSANVVAVDSDENDATRTPLRMSLKHMLERWVAFRFSCIRKRAQHAETKAASRRHILAGLRLAVTNVDAVVQLIRASSSPADAKLKLTEYDFGEVFMDDEQAEAVLKLQLSRLTSLEAGKVDSEIQDLDGELLKLGNILSTDALVYGTMIDELKEIKAKHAVPRKTAISASRPVDFREEDVIENGRSAILVSRSNYVKRTPMLEFAEQRRGTKGSRVVPRSTTLGLNATRTNQAIEHFVSCHDHDTLLCIADDGIAYGIRAYELPRASRSQRGVTLRSVLPWLEGEQRKLSGLLPLSKDAPTEKMYLTLLTKGGQLKKTPLSAFTDLSARGLIAITLQQDDSVGWARLCTGDDSILIATANGNVLRVPCDESSLRASGRKSMGVKSIALKDGDKVVGMDVAKALTDGEEEPHSHALFLTARGNGKRVSLNTIKFAKRGGQGVLATKFKPVRATKKIPTPVQDTLVGLICAREEDECMIVTQEGMVVRQSLSGIPQQSRGSMGVSVQSLTKSQETSEEDFVMDVCVIPADLLAAETAAVLDDAEAE